MTPARHHKLELARQKSPPVVENRLAKFASQGKIASELTVRRRSDAMPTRNVNLTAELDDFVLSKVESGRYENASEVIRAALRTLEREEKRYEAKLATLRAAIDSGDASGVARGDVFVRVRAKLKLPSTPR